jgi:hypothetical protein
MTDVLEFKKGGEWREEMQNSEWKTCVSFVVDAANALNIARNSQTGIF